MVGFVAWTLVLLLLFWFPFDFRIERTFLGERIHLLERVPFHAYYYGTEYRAVTELLHKILFFMPLGALLAVGRSRMAPSVAREIYQLVALGMILAVPAGVELGQIALPGKNPDTTDWVLEVLGGAAGYLGLLYLRKRVYAGYAHRRGLHAVDSS
jgi:glycopeptide antibiotics resistance protein